jgi:hypothetical protein
MDIQLSSETQIYLMGWYGTCEDEEPFLLSTIDDKLSGVIQINEFGDYTERYDPNKPAWKSHPFTSLNKGYSYLIIFKIVDESIPMKDRIISIPGFVSANHQGWDRSSYPYTEKEPGDGHGRISPDCEYEYTPTPTPYLTTNSTWMSFSATDVNTDNYFTSWHELEVLNTELYTKLVPKDKNTLRVDFSNFKGTNLLNIAILQSKLNPNESFNPKTIFASGDLDLSCKECGSTLPRLILLDDSGGKFIYTDRIFKSGGTCYGSNQLSTKETSDWYEAPVVYNTINAPQKSVMIQELYFDIPNGSKLKFEEFNC